MSRAATKLTSMLGVTLVLSLMAAETAEARRGGSFGSRGMRTYSAPRTTATAPQATAPIQRSMTPNTQRPGATAQAPAAAGAQAQAPRRGGFLGGMGGGILGGLVAGGLLGMFLGHGWGGAGAGMMNSLIQLAVIGGGIWLLMTLFRRRRTANAAPMGYARDNVAPFGGARGFEQPASGGFGGGASAVPPAPEPETVEIGVTQADRDRFEELLSEVQAAFGREDYAALRERTTPEIMSYLSEELSQNATQGRRNEVSDVRLLQADVAEAWREDDTDYATAALRYSSIDVMRDRTSNAVLEGDADKATETTELWTFTRPRAGAWKLSAIQEA